MTPQDLAQINNFERLVDFLRGQLEWPIPDDYEFEDVTYEYEPTELGLKPEQIAKIREVHQLRPLTTNQPWGVFFVSFEEKGLPITVMRRILRSLVLTKRADAKDADRAAWQRSDLLFISAHGKGGARELSFAHFADGKETGDLPVLRVLNWNRDDTVLHNRYVQKMLDERLRWPDDPSDTRHWKETWAGAFQIAYREAINTSKDLSKALAGLASQIRARANELLEAEVKGGPMRKMHEAFRENLIQDLSEDDFADMFAQTISYGLLAARISRSAVDEIEDDSGMSGGLVADNLTDMIPSTNPFLKELFASFLKLGGRDKRKAMNFDELGVRDVVDLLNAANMKAVLRDFGDKNPKEDPVIHFYELFLKEYDPEKRMQRGVFYTPRPVVNFIVRGVDEVLRTEFDLPLGLADTTTWGELAARNENITVPDHIDPDAPFVQILDPATGTGTFLVEVIDLIHKRMVETWTDAGKTQAEIDMLWRAYVSEHLLPRLTAFELMMAPYAIAHMKLGLKLFETGYRFEDDVRARVFLTNALQPPRASGGQVEMFGDALAHECAAADETKSITPFTVVVGNPPYSLQSANMDKNARDLIQPFKFVEGRRIVERNALQLEKNLNDDYVKFFALVIKLLTPQTLFCSGLITNHSFLDNPTLRGMRWKVSQTFNFLRIVDLHGNSTKKEEPPAQQANENIFEIKQGTAISIFANLPSSDRSSRHMSFWGTRSEKEDGLLETSVVANGESSMISPQAPKFLFIPRNNTNFAEFSNGVLLPDIVPIHGAGFISARDGLVVDFDRDELTNRITSFANSDLDNDSLLKKFSVAAKKGWDVDKARSLLKSKNIDSLITQVAYRPFDKRHIFYDSTLVWGCSWPTAQHIVSLNNLALLATRITKDQWDVSICDRMASHKAMSAYDSNIVFPLWLQPTSADPHRRPNLDARLAESFGAPINLTYEDGLPKGQSNLGPDYREQETPELDMWDGRGDLKSTFGPRDLFDWIYAVLHSPAYRTRYAEFLKSDFPRIPRPASRDLFAALIPLGRELVALHLLKPDEAPILQTPEIRFVGSGEPRVAKSHPKFVNGKVMINASRWFEDVPRETWEFKVGGYQVLDKWLKDRAEKGGKNPKPGRVLTDEDILHYRRVVVALTETRRLMSEIDHVIESHGGWPDAFTAE
jgi:hypothetical protein